MSIASAGQDNGGWDLPHSAPIPFADFCRELLSLYEPPLRAKGTGKKLQRGLDLVAELLGPNGTTADLTPNLVARLVASRPATESPHTTAGHLAGLRTACSYALSQGYVRASPFHYRKRWIRLGQPRGKRHHSREDIRRVLDLLAAEVRGLEGWPRWRARRLQAVAATVAYTGMRRNEALGLHAADVDLEHRMIFLVERDGSRMKTERSAQPVPIPEELAPILAGWMARRLDAPEGGFRKPPDCPYLFPNVTRTNAWKAGPYGHKPLDQLKAAGERAGVAGLTFLSLRHSYATHAESWGLSPAMIQRVLRHTSLRTQWHYRHPDVANMRAATGGISFGPAPAPGAGAGPEGGPTP